MSKVLFFSPHAGIWVHSFPEALVAEALKQFGSAIVYVGCDRDFSSYCVTMGSKGLSPDSPQEDKEAVCSDCVRKKGILRSGFGLAGPDVGTVLTTEDLVQIESLAASRSASDLLEFEIDGFPLGRAAMYELLIQSKKARYEFTEQDMVKFRPALENLLKSFWAARKVLGAEKPDRVIVYNSLYSVNAAWRIVAEHMGIPVYFLHAGGGLSDRLRTLMIGRGSTLKFLDALVGEWPRFKEVPADRKSLAVVTDHFIELLAAKNVFAYSAPKNESEVDVRARFGISPNQKILVATMSSYDEYFAAKSIGEVPDDSNLIFPTQIDWIRAVVKCLRNRPDWFLLIRVHPREFPNKRDGLKSEHARQLEGAFVNLPKNVRVNWPSDGVSIYDLAEHTDIFLNAWSSAGKEMALLGLPVVVYCPQLLQYPAELGYVAESEEDYFAQIERGLREGWSFERIRKAFRWCALEYDRSIIDIRDGFDFDETPSNAFVNRAARKVLRTLPGLAPRLDLWRRPKALRESRRIADAIKSGARTPLDLVEPGAERVSAEEERGFLTQELRRLYQALYAGDDKPIREGTLRSRLRSAFSR